MAAVNMTIADALDAKIRAVDSPWGGDVAAWKAWLKDQTRKELLNARLRKLESDSVAALDAARAAALTEDAASA